MIWVIALVALAIVFGGLGLIIEALQFLLVLGAVLLVAAIVAGFLAKRKVTDAVSGSDQGDREPGRPRRE